ncbi:MAG TPA: bifunctional glutamate N-acetyltransferase/amino-acid acetyltransferase ArgJ [Bryobacteraceae bacterium]|jgi:glutamate N-acetyltransferase/amino-acid N-acetyltransferase|nr:bifunctional glutamate N-acetyltransferase/amino-acid acetyltransferase ArgJ [Bryobacteraceae bacterium]
MHLPLGYRYSSLYAGIRKDERDDLGLIVSDLPAAAAAVFTTNLVQAAPVQLSRQRLAKTGGEAAAILVNAGNANCATRTGTRVAVETTRAVAKALKLRPEHVLPASTGVIGVELDAARITNAIPKLIQGLSPVRFEDVARAMMTTDTAMKVSYSEIKLARGTVRFAGMTKGSGMIHPNMATTLGFAVTDAKIPVAHLRGMLKHAVSRSFNRVTVDGDMSTNDTFAVLANGACGVAAAAGEREAVQEALSLLMEDLARQIARDGEGARKLIVIDVSGAATEADATRIARAIGNSPLVKTAVAGSDPNWGRILSSAGASGVAFDPRKADIYLQGVKVCKGGLAEEFSEAEMKKKLDEPECRIRFVLRRGGSGSSRFWSCDFTEDYIRINASYRT